MVVEANEFSPLNTTLKPIHLYYSAAVVSSFWSSPLNDLKEFNTQFVRSVETAMPGENEDSLVSQLPEADALPDGFAESFSETADSTVSTGESDKMSKVDQRDEDYLDGKNSDFEARTQESEAMSSLFSVSCIEQASLMPEAPEFCKGAGTASSISDSRTEKTEKARTFPVQLSDKDVVGFHGSLAESSKKDGLDRNNIKQDITTLESIENASVDEYFSPRGCHSPADIPPLLSTIDGLTAGPSQNTNHFESDCLKSNQYNLKEVEKKEAKAFQTSEQDSNGSSRSSKLESHVEAKSKQTKGTSKLERELADSHHKYLQVVMERDTALVELRKNVAIREKLESLCRELQRQNKMLTDECKKVSTEGQQKRLDLSTKFHDAIKEASTKLGEERDENEMLRQKLKQFSEQYELREQQFMQQLKKKTLELQLAEVKLQQQLEACHQEQAKVQLYTEQISQLLETEKNLRLQLAADGEKFQQFQETLTKSNEVFESFKKEMEKMAKTIKDLNKENNFLKRKCEKTDVSLIELVDEREKVKKQLEKTKNQKEKLESLCRSLQAERKQQSEVNTPTEVLLGTDNPDIEDPGKST